MPLIPLNPNTPRGRTIVAIYYGLRIVWIILFIGGLIAIWYSSQHKAPSASQSKSQSK